MSERTGHRGGRVESAGLSWLLTAALAGLALVHGFDGSYRWFVFTGFTVVLVVLPVALVRDPNALPPWELLVLVLVPVVDATWAGETAFTTVSIYVAVAAVALVVAVEIERFTAVRMTHTFAVVLVVLTTLAVAAGWNVALWLSDVALGTDYVVGGRSQAGANEALMIEFLLAAIAGAIAGVGFDRYFHSETPAAADPPGERAAPSTGSRPAPESATSAGPSFVRGRLGVSGSTVVALSRGLQVGLGLVLLYGLVVRDVTTVVNAGIALALTFLPTLLQRDGRLPLEPELVFWLSAAVFLHALGSAGLYDLVGPLDNLTHAVSASVVAAAGYAGVRALDLHTDDIYLPPTMLVAFIFVFVLAFGVVWELVEFAVDWTAEFLGLEAVLAQHGIDDTIGDLVFDFVGAVVVAASGSLYLTDLSRRIADELDE